MNLGEALEKRGTTFPVSEVVEFARVACGALEFAHNQNLLHRDVKPANIMLGNDGRTYLTDFGVARTLHELEDRLLGRMITGTVIYMSPEQLQGKRLDKRSDIYSLAATLYEMLSGKPPFLGSGVTEQIQFKQPDPLTNVPESVNAVLLRALAKCPDDRHPSCLAFYDALRMAAANHAGEIERTDSVAARHDPDAKTVRLQPPTPEYSSIRLGALLSQAGVIGDEQLAEALRVQEKTGEKIGAALIRLGHAGEQNIAEAISSQLGLALVNLNEITLDVDTFKLIPLNFAREHKCIPIRKESGKLIVALADPLDFAAINHIETHTGTWVEVCIAPESEISKAIESIYSETKQG